MVLWVGLASQAAAEPPVLVACDDPPAAVLALAETLEIQAYGVASEASLVVVSVTNPGEGTGSSLRFSRAGASQKSVKLAGRVLGLAVAPDGKSAYAIVRVTNRKGVVRSVELVAVDLETARVSSGPTIPASARGLALGAGGSTLLVASRDELRSFQLPGLASGPLYRVLGDNVGVAAIAGSSSVIVAQTSRVVLADLAGPQGRDGLALSEEVSAPAPLRGMLASAGDAGPIALAEGGLAWCVQATAPPPLPPPVVAEPLPDPPIPETSKEPGTVSGVVAGPAVAEVAAIVVLGPDNVLREAARVVPDEKGRFAASGLSPGAYRLVAAGKAGRVLICQPSFLTIRVDSNGAIEAPVLKVLSAQ